MAISGISSATSAYVTGAASDGDSAAVEAKESAATKSAEKQNGGVAPKTGSTSGQQSDLSKLRMYVNQHMSASQIAQRLGKSVSTVMQEAAAAGINLNTSNSSSTTSKNPAVGNNVNTTA